jgi:hypothetical protein
MQALQNAPLSSPIHSRAEADNLALVLEDTLEKMATLLAQETSLARAGKLRHAIELQPEKARLTEAFIHTAERFRANAAYFKSELPGTIIKIRALYEKFHVEIGRNMTALATATALSESLINEVVETVQEHERPAGYTLSGQVPNNSKASAPPLKLNLSL